MLSSTANDQLTFESIPLLCWANAIIQKKRLSLAPLYSLSQQQLIVDFSAYIIQEAGCPIKRLLESRPAVSSHYKSQQNLPASLASYQESENSPLGSVEEGDLNKLTKQEIVFNVAQYLEVVHSKRLGHSYKAILKNDLEELLGLSLYISMESSSSRQHADIILSLSSEVHVGLMNRLRMISSRAESILELREYFEKLEQFTIQKQNLENKIKACETKNRDLLEAIKYLEHKYNQVQNQNAVYEKEKATMLEFLEIDESQDFVSIYKDLNKNCQTLKEQLKLITAERDELKSGFITITRSHKDNLEVVNELEDSIRRYAGICRRLKQDLAYFISIDSIGEFPPVREPLKAQAINIPESCLGLGSTSPNRSEKGLHWVNRQLAHQLEVSESEAASLAAQCMKSRHENAKLKQKLKETESKLQTIRNLKNEFVNRSLKIKR